MSSNSAWECRYCIKKIEDIKKELYGKIPLEKFNKLKNAGTVDKFIELLPDKYKEWIEGDVGRLDGCDLDGEFFEDWGDGVYVGEDGNLHISISGSCDLCGREFNYEIILPESDDTETLDLSKIPIEKIKELIKNYGIKNQIKQKAGGR